MHLTHVFAFLASITISVNAAPLLNVIDKRAELYNPRVYTQADENPALPSTEIDKRNELYVAQLYTHADEDLALPSTKIDESREVYTPQVFRADKKTALPSPEINKRNELYNAQVYTQADENRALPITGLDSGDKKETAEGDLSSRATESNTLVDAVAKRDDGFVYKSSVVHNVDGAK